MSDLLHCDELCVLAVLYIEGKKNSYMFHPYIGHRYDVVVEHVFHHSIRFWSVRDTWIPCNQYNWKCNCNEMTIIELVKLDGEQLTFTDGQFDDIEATSTV